MILFNSFPRKYCYSEINTADSESEKQIYKKELYNKIAQQISERYQLKILTLVDKTSPRPTSVPGFLCLLPPLEVVPAARDPVHVGQADLQQQRVHLPPDSCRLVQAHRYPTQRWLLNCLSSVLCRQNNVLRSVVAEPKLFNFGSGYTFPPLFPFISATASTPPTLVLKFYLQT